MSDVRAATLAPVWRVEHLQFSISCAESTHTTWPPDVSSVKGSLVFDSCYNSALSTDPRLLLKIGILGQKYGSHRFLKHLVKFRNWGAKVALDFYRAISKTRISTVATLLGGHSSHT